MPFIKDFNSRLVTKGAASGLALISSVCVTRFLGPAGEGAFSFVNANVALLSLLFGFQLPVSITYFISSETIKQSSVIGLALISTFVSTIIAALTVYVIGKTNPNLILPSEVSESIVILFILLISLTLLNNLFFAILNGNKKFGVFNRLSLFQVLIDLLLTVSLLLGEGYLLIEDKVVAVLVIKVVTLTLLLILNYWYYTKNFSFRPDFSLELKKCKQLFAYAFLTYVAVAINFLNLRLDVWMVKSYTGLEELGYYSVASRWSEMGLILVNALGTILIPYMASKTLEIDDFQKIVKLVFTIFIGLGAFMILVGSQFITTMFGEVFHPAVLPFRILQIGLLFLSLRSLFSMANSSNMDKVRYNILASLSGFIVTMGLGLLIIPNYGIVGASITSVCSYLISFLVLFYLFCREHKIPMTVTYFIFSEEEIASIFLKLKGCINQKRISR